METNQKKKNEGIHLVQTGQTQSIQTKLQGSFNRLFKFKPWNLDWMLCLVVVEKTGRMRDKNLCFGEERRWYVEERVEVTMDWTPQPHPQRTQTHTKNGKSWLRPEQANRHTKTLFTSATSILIIRLKIDCSTFARVTLISLYVLLTSGALASIITSIVQDSSCITTTRPACTTNVKNDDQIILNSSITRFFLDFL